MEKMKPVVATCSVCRKEYVTINPNEDLYCWSCRYGDDEPEQVICSNCGNEMEQNEIHEETWTGKYRNVLVVKDYIRYYCEHCENWR